MVTIKWSEFLRVLILWQRYCVSIVTVQNLKGMYYQNPAMQDDPLASSKQAAVNYPVSQHAALKRDYGKQAVVSVRMLTITKHAECTHLNMCASSVLCHFSGSFFYEP